MIENDIQQGRLSAAVRRAMAAARMRQGAVPVRDIADEVIRESGSDPGQLDDVVDALCALCIRSGLIIEFSSTRAAP